MTQSTALRYPKGYQFFDANGKPLALGTLTYQVAGGSTLQDTWSDSAGTVANTNPVVLDGSGRTQIDIYLGSTGLSDYKETLKDSTGATVSPWPVDNIPKATGNAGVSTDLSLTLRTGDADLNITTGSGVTIPGATTSLAGLMSAADKVKVNNLTGVYVAMASQVVIKNNVSTPDSKITVSTGPTMMTDGSGNGAFSASASETIDLSVSAASTGNCLDTGSLGSNAWYHVFQITNGTDVAFLASASDTAPTLPSGYTKFVRLGAMLTDGSSALMRTFQKGNTAEYDLVTGTNTTAYPAISGTGLQSISGVVPPTAASIRLSVVANAQNTGASIMSNNSVSGGNSTDIANWFCGNTTNFPALTGEFNLGLIRSTININSQGQGIRCRGWIDQVNVLS